MVGTVSGEGVIPSITGIYEEDGIKGVKVATLGGRRVLVSFPNLEEFSLLLDNPKAASNQVFVSLQRWVPEPSTSLRKVWLQCFGVPLQGWSAEVLESIGRKVGDVVEVGPEMLNKSSLEFGRICVQTGDYSFIYKEMEIRIFDHLFRVVAREKMVFQGCSIMDGLGHSKAIEMVKIRDRMHTSGGKRKHVFELADSTSDVCAGEDGKQKEFGLPSIGEGHWRSNDVASADRCPSSQST
ncbi:hypothetical protein AAC387_Pa03g4601 [Persea americana]